SPAEVKGTGFLAYTYKGRPADQWLYLPELKRIRQITPRSRTESFVGTDLSYQDLDIIQEMSSWSEADARSSLRGEETVDGVPTYVIELIPQREDIGYKKIVIWLGRDDLVPRRLEFYGDGSEPTKRIVQRDLHDVGRIPMAQRIEVETPARGSRTTIESSDAAFDQHYEDDLFTQRALERGQRGRPVRTAPGRSWSRVPSWRESPPGGAGAPWSTCRVRRRRASPTAPWSRRPIARSRP